jgi:hypothetical protein
MVIMMCTLPCKIVWADDLQLYEQQIKAGLLYNFLKYTQWPEKKTLVTVCVFGDDPFEGYLKPMVGRSVNQREITLRFIHTIEEVDTCDLLYINAKERKQWPTLQKSLVEKSVLTVSDFDGFAASGGMIEFGKKEEHVDASLNIDAITAAHLQVQDRLLKLVTVVHPPKAGGR